MTNTLAYYDTDLITAVKRFTEQGPSFPAFPSFRRSSQLINIFLLVKLGLVFKSQVTEFIIYWQKLTVEHLHEKTLFFVKIN